MPHENRQTLIWTALPNRIVQLPDSEPMLRVSVFVAPQVHVPVLPDEWRDWPALVDDRLAFTISFQTLAPVNGRKIYVFHEEGMVDVDGICDRPEVACATMTRVRHGGASPHAPEEARQRWAALFDRNQLANVRGGLWVKPFEREKTAGFQPGIPSLATAARIQEIYGSTTASTALLDCDGADPIAETARLVATVHSPPQQVRVGPARVREKVRSFDFHQRISALNEYPALLRMFRLVVDFDIPLADVKGITEGRVWAVPCAPSALSAAKFPETTMHVMAVNFRQFEKAGDRTITSVDELNGEARSKFSLMQMDVEGASLKLEMWRSNRRRNPPAAGADDQTLPALRTRGITVVHRNVVGDMCEALERQDAVHDMVYRPRADVVVSPVQSPDEPVKRSTLVRGYRVDVRDETIGDKRWRSLCLRRGTYRFLDADLPDIENLVDEGTVSETTLEAPGTLSMLNDVLCTWTGWSLAVDLPGKEREATDAVQREYQKLPNNERLPLVAAFGPVVGSLPRLRFGHEYSVRLRSVDLAGNSVGIDDDSVPIGRPEVADLLGPTIFRRFEPLPPPPIAFADGSTVPETTSGRRDTVEVDEAGAAARQVESEQAIVLRSTHRTIRPDGSVDFQLAEPVARILLPPAGSRWLCELHGMFDGSNPGRIYDVLEKRDHVGRSPAADPSSLRIQHLPDPASRTIGIWLVRLLDSCDGPSDVVHVSFAGRWPDLKGVRLRIEAAGADEPPTVTTATRAEPTVVVRVPAGQQYDLCLRSVIPAKAGRGDEEVPGADCFAPDRPKGAVIPQAWYPVLQPVRKIRIVHAVDVPLKAPAPVLQGAYHVSGHPRFCDGQPELERPVSQVPLDLAIKTLVDDPTRAKLDLHAVGTEWVDDLRTPSPREVTRALDPIPVPPMKESGVSVRHSVPDTRYRKITYTAVSSSRFANHFKASSPRREAVATVKLLSSGRPPPPVVSHVVPAFEWEGGPAPRDSSDVRANRGGGWLRIYLKRPWLATGEGERLAILCLPEVAVNVDRSRTSRDALPEMLPAARYASMWGRDPIRMDALDQPKSRFLVTSDFDKRFGEPKELTGPEYGLDTIAELERFIAPLSRPVVVPQLLNCDGPPLPGDVRALLPDCDGPHRADCDGRSLAGAELAVAAASLRGRLDAVLYDVQYPPHFDPANPLCFVDVKIDLQVKSWEGQFSWPFVRLALARYQEDSVGGARLSSAVMLDVMQLLPDRPLGLTCTLDSAGRAASVTLIDIDVHALDPFRNRRDGRQSHNRFTIMFEQQLRDTSRKGVWVPASNALERGVVPGRSIPCPPTSGVFPLRALVREYEAFDDDRGVEANRCIFAAHVNLPGHPPG